MLESVYDSNVENPQDILHIQNNVDGALQRLAVAFLLDGPARERRHFRFAIVLRFQVEDAQSERHTGFVTRQSQDRFVFEYLGPRGYHVPCYVTTTRLINVLRALAWPVQAESREDQWLWQHWRSVAQLEDLC